MSYLTANLNRADVPAGRSGSHGAWHPHSFLARDINGQVVYTADWVDGMRIEVGAYSDKVRGSYGSDLIFAGGGDDFVDGKGGNDRIDGGDGDDRLFGGTGNDIIRAGTGNDVLHGGRGDDNLFGDAGDDRVSGDGGMDRLNGGEGHDILMGGDGNDSLRGNEGSDWLYGGEGNDTLIGDEGNDLLHGNAGNDTFIFLRGHGHDTIFARATRNQGASPEHDQVRFRHIEATELTSVRLSADIPGHPVLEIRYGEDDQVDIYFDQTGKQLSVDSFLFEEGTRLDVDQLRRLYSNEGGTLQQAEADRLAFQLSAQGEMSGGESVCEGAVGISAVSVRVPDQQLDVRCQRREALPG